AVRAGDGAGQRLHRAERPRYPGGHLPPPAGGPARGGVDGEDGRGLRAGAEARHAAGRRPGHRHRPADHAADPHPEHPRRDPLPAAAAREVRSSDRIRGEAVYKLVLCLRYLRTRYLALVCIVSVMLGVATLIVVNSVMSGFSTKLKERLHGMLSDVVIE